MNNADLKKYALNLLEMSQKFLSEDGDLDSNAFIITAKDQLLRPIELRDDMSKIESCKKIVAEARRQNALAIVTIFLARSADFAHEDFDHEGYSWGDIQDKSKERSILVTISSPGIKNWAAALPFKETKGKINFGNLIEFTQGLELNLFPGWSDQRGSTAS